MRVLMIMAMIVLLTTGAAAQQTLSYGWEDGISTTFGSDGNVGGSANVTDLVHTGSHALYGFEAPLGGTPQMYLVWITNLVDGDEITASFWVYDVTPLASPSTRIWGHYTDEHYLDYTVNKRVPRPTGNRVHYAAPHGCYACAGADEWCAIAVFSDEEWRSFRI